MADYDAAFGAPAPAASTSAPTPDNAGPQILEPSAPPPVGVAAPETLPPLPPPLPASQMNNDAPNPYEAYFDNQNASQKAQAQSSFYLAKGTDPEHAGQVLNLSAKTGVDPDFVSRNLTPLLEDQQMGAVDINKLSRLYPAITKLAADQMKAAAIKDDIPGLRKTEDRVTEHTAIAQAGNILASAALEFAAGITKIPALASDVLDYRENLAYAMSDSPKRVTSDSAFYGRNNPVTRYLEDKAKDFRRGAPILEEDPVTAFSKNIYSRPNASIPERVMDAASEGDYARAGTVLLAHGVAQAPMLIALFGGAMVGVGPIAALALGAQTAADKNAANLENNVDPISGIPNAAMHGAIVSYMDRLGAFEYFTGVGSRLTQKFGPEVAKQVMRSYGGTLAETMGLEASKMAGMSIAGDFADFATGVNRDAFAGSLARAASAGMLGGLIGAATTAPVEGFVRAQEMRRAQNAKRLVENLVTDSAGKTRDRAPELHSEFVRNTVEGTPYAEAQIDPQALETFFQKKGEDPIKAMQDLGFLDQFAFAKETGTRIRIPTDVLVDKIQKSGHTDLADHVTFHEEDSSVADLEARAHAEEQVAQANKESLDQAESVALNERGLTPDQQRAESAETVRQHIEGQLEEAGQDKRQAVLVSKTIQTLAARTGQDPLELFNRINFSVSGPDSQLEVPSNAVKLNQDAADTESIARAKDVLNRHDTAKKASALSGDDRQEYLDALDTMYGARDKRAQDQGFGDQNVNYGTTADIDPQQIRSTNTAFDPRFKDSPLLLAQSDAYRDGFKPSVDTFFSKLTRTVEDKMPNSAPPDQVRGILKEMKPEEKKWLQVEDFLKDKTKVSKAELIEFLRANNPQIVDVTKGYGAAADAEPGLQVTNIEQKNGDWNLTYSDGTTQQFDAREGDTPESITAMALSERAQDPSRPRPNSDPKYANYTLPGGENYREVLFTMPESHPSELPDGFTIEENQAKAAAEKNGSQYMVMGPRSENGIDHRYASGRTPEEAKANFFKKHRSENNYRSSHWDEANVLAFTRLNDRTDSAGKRVLHVEEVQSDWHQAGRKHGYADLTREEYTQRLDDLNKKIDEASDDSAKIALKEEREKLHTQVAKGIPDAPFRKTWHEFALKKIIRMAAEGGYDKVTWTTGEQQAERYNLAKKIDRIQYSESKRQPGHYNVIAYDLNGRDSLGGGMQYAQSPEQIEAMFGKEIAKKIEAGEGSDPQDGTKNEKALSGLQLAVGGEGMKGFYDKIIPDYLRKFGKKYGTTVGDTELAEYADTNSNMYAWQDEDTGQWFVRDPENNDRIILDNNSFRTEQEANEAISEHVGHEIERTTVHSLDITPQLRDAALHQGFELFQGGDQTPRGQISISPDRINIQLLEKADRSTFIHETGHFIVEMMRRLSTENEGIKNDLDTLLKHVGNEGGDITVEQHEEIARSFEGYLMEGKAPTEGLRKAFVRMKTWLVDVYKHIRALNINLTDDVRAVFDRVLATDEEIAQARTDQNFGTLFEGPARQQITPEQYAKIGFAVDAAKQAAEDHLRAEVMQDIKKEETETWHNDLEKERVKARAEANEMQVYKATALLQRGETPDGVKLGPDLQRIKINRQALVDLYGKDVLEKLPKPLVYSKEGLHPDAVADMLGYESGKQMVDELVSFPKQRDFVEETAQAEMKKKSPDLYKSSRMVDEAVKAIHNNEQAKVMRLEMDYLREMSKGAERDLTRMVARRPPPPDRVLKETVRAELGRMKFDDVRPNTYRIAERQAAKAAGEALAKGDIDGAYEAKRKELLNHELFRAATEAKDDVQKTLKFFKRLNRTDEDLAKTRDTNLVNTARAILARIGIGKDQNEPQFYLEKMKAYDPEGYEAAAYHVANVTGTKQAMNYRENTMGAFRETADSVKAIWDLAGDVNKIEREGKKIRLDEVVTDLVSQLGYTGDLSTVKAGMTRAVTKAENIKLNLMSWRASLTRVEHWVHGKDLSDFGGVFTQAIWDPIQKATTQKKLKYNEMIEKYKAHVKDFKDIFDTKPIEAPELGYTFANKKELLGAIMHTGNESNLSKLLRGRNWGELTEEGALDRSRWDQFTERMQREGHLKGADYDFVQGVWNMYESIKPDAQKAHKKMFGYHFNEVTADPFTVNGKEYKGGYAPAVADPNIANDAAMRREAEAFGNHGNMMLMPTGGRGFTKGRVEGYAAPLALDLDYVPMAVDKVLRFTYVEGAARDVSKIVFDRKFAEALNTVDPGAHEMLVGWLNRAAKQTAGVPSGQGRGWRALDGFFRAVRTRTGLGAMAGNVVNAFHQTTGFSVVTSIIEPHYVRDSLAAYVKDAPNVTKDIMEKSEWMRAHHADPHAIQGEIEDLMINPGKIKTAEEWAKKNAYILQRYTAGMTESVAWSGAYSKALVEGKTDAQSVLFADSVVRRTQHAMDAIDVAAYETGSPIMKMFTQFTGYYNNKANLLGSKAMASIRELGIKKAAIPLVGLYVSIQMIPAIMAKAAYRAAEGKLDENDDGRYMDDVWNLFFHSQVDETLALAPFVGPTINHAIKTATSDRPRDERFVMAPGFAMIEKLGMVIPHTRDAIKGKGKPSAAIKDWLTLLGMFTGLPAQPFAKPLGYAADVASGKTRSRGPLDYTRGLITGYGPRH